MSNLFQEEIDRLAESVNKILSHLSEGDITEQEATSLIVGLKTDNWTDSPQLQKASHN